MWRGKFTGHKRSKKEARGFHIGGACVKRWLRADWRSAQNTSSTSQLRSQRARAHTGTQQKARARADSPSQLHARTRRSHLPSVQRLTRRTPRSPAPEKSSNGVPAPKTHRARPRKPSGTAECARQLLGPPRACRGC